MIPIQLHYCSLVFFLLLSGCRQRVEGQKAVTVSAPTDTALSLTYIANAGVLICSGQDKVLIDALHRPYSEYYIPTPDTLMEKIIQGLPPFDGVDAFIVSHVHGDHFDAATVAEYLVRHPQVKLVGAHQVRDSLEKATLKFAQVRQQLITFPYEAYASHSTQIGNISIQVFDLPHGSAKRNHWVQNIATITEIGGYRLLHTGDPDFREEPIRAFGFQEMGIDIGLLPDWFQAYEEGAELVKKYIRPKAHIGVHVSPQWMEENRKRAARLFPEAVLLTEVGEVIIK